MKILIIHAVLHEVKKMYKAITNEMEIYEAKCTKGWIKRINYILK